MPLPPITMPPWTSVPARLRPLARSSALNWLPATVCAAEVRVPRTLVVRIDPHDFWCALDGEPGGEIPWEELHRAAAAVGFPCFVRTDMSSAKHAGPGVYRVDSAQNVERAVLSTFEDSAAKDLATGPTPLRAILFREWIDIDARFSAFGYHISGLKHPIGPEWRVFAREGTTLCHHFYWPEDAIEQPSAPDWRQRLRKMAEQPVPEVVLQAARAVSAQLEGAWSVDFAQDRAGQWWLIDMADAVQSWHPPCPDAVLVHAVRTSAG